MVEFTLVFATQELLNEQQRREKPSDSAAGSKVALKSTHKFSNKKR